MITQRAINKISEKIAKKYKPEKIYLFGSFVWGKPNFDSDVDFFIIKKTKKKKFDRQLQVRKIVSGELPVDILVYNQEEIGERLSLGDLFLKKILNQGKLIYDAAL